jgi:hypothetical protein
MVGLPGVRAPAQPPVLHTPAQVGKPAQSDAQPDVQLAHPAQRPAPRPIWAVMTPASILIAALVLVVLALGGTGLVMNARYAS